jgi:hypothetical protein
MRNNDPMIRHHLFRALAVLLLSSWFGAAVSAQESGSATPDAASEPPAIWFVIAPEGGANGDYFDVPLEAGQSATVTGTFGNGSTIPVTALIYAADAYSDVNGGFALKEIESERTGSTTWLDFPQQEHDFDAGEGITLSFTVTVPEGTPPGQYITGVAIETSEARDLEGDLPIRQKFRLITPVLITVPGPIEPGFEIGGLAIVTDQATSVITGTVTNTGNIRVRPEGNVVLTDQQGHQVVDAPLTMRSVYAHDSAILSIALAAPIPEGTYYADAHFIDPDTDVEVSLTHVELQAAAPPTPSPLTIDDVVLTPMPSADQVVFIQATVTVGNSGNPATGAIVTLVVYRDGELVDQHVLANSLTLQNGQTVIDQPYIPADGAWPSGTYTFEVALSTTDPSSGATTAIGTYRVGEQIVIP